MNGQQLLMGVGFVDEKYIDEAENIKKTKKPIRIWKGIAIAACFSFILTGAFIVSFHQFTKETPGYYDMYVISFSVDATEYQFVFEQIELEEAIKVVASFITETDKIEISY